MAPFLLVALFALGCLCDLSTHVYTFQEPVVVWANKIGPFSNPQETYPYYTLPFCPPHKHEESSEGLGEALLGYELLRAPYPVLFNEETRRSHLCKFTATEAQVAQLRYAVLNDYWFQFFVDDLPVWGIVGEYSTDTDDRVEVSYYSHLTFAFSFNRDRIIHLNVTPDTPVTLPPSGPFQLPFSFSVTWQPTDVLFDDRFDRYLDQDFFQHRIHWFSLINSLMMVALLVGLVSLIVFRTLKRDVARFADFEQSLDGELVDESGWKQVSGDVFRAPRRLLLLSVLYGVGLQLAALLGTTLLLALLGSFYMQRGTVVTCAVTVYFFTTFLAGYAGAGMYRRHGGVQWQRQLLVAVLMLPSVCACVAAACNVVAYAYGSLNYVPASTMLVVACLWVFVGSPLTLVGTLVGKNLNAVPSWPCRVQPIPRAIPDKLWYQRQGVHAALGGAVQFGTVFIEVFFLLSALYKVYYLYGYSLAVFGMLLMVVACVAIVSTFVLLNAEDYRWMWTSFSTGAAAGGYTFLYCVYYYMAKTNMHGFLQFSFYHGYAALLSALFALLCGSVALLSSSLFVQAIYRSTKMD